LILRNLCKAVIGYLSSRLSCTEVSVSEKETGTLHWNDPNTGATNESGFTALPGDYRRNEGTFNIIGDGGYWWSYTEVSADNARFRAMACTLSTIYRGQNYKALGFSVRCVRD